MIQATERDISRAVVNHLEEMCVRKKIVHWVNLEGEYRNPIQRRRAKHHGMRAGRPDLEIVLPLGKILFIELKRLKGGRLTDPQKEVQQDLSNLGHDYRVVRALDCVSAVKMVQSILEEYGIT